MSSISFLFSCVLACLIHSISSQCLGSRGVGYNKFINRGYGLSGYNGLGFADDFSYGAGYGARRASAGAAESALGAGWGAAGAGLGAAGAGLGATGAGLGAAGAGLSAAGVALDVADGLSGPGFGYSGIYGSLGDGNMYVVGELPVTGNTLVSGAVPILGSVFFGGNVPAAGTVSVSGHSGCTCGRF